MFEKVKKTEVNIIKVIIMTATVIAVALPLLIFFVQKQKIYTNIENVEHYEIGIVFGAGVKPDGTPTDMLVDRLTTAAKLYNEGKVEKLLVSGDNRTDHYNEPEAMYKYLTEVELIPTDRVVRDFAGRRTYDTCARAHEIWGIDNALLITQGYHLPRALFLCNALGVESAGYSATLHTYVSDEQYEFREYLAIGKSIIDLYIWTPDYVKGEKETL
jgi:vancomycin permeability regulator SanA